MAIKKWKLLGEKTLFKNDWWDLRQETIELPDGSVIDDYTVNHPHDGAAVLPITESGAVIVNRQYKHGIREVIREFCVGRIEDGDGPAALDAAKRELLEETGYGGGTWEKLATFTGNPTSSTSVIHVFVARGLKKMREPQHDPRETVEIEEVAPAELDTALQQGEALSELSWAIIGLARAKGILT